MALLALDLVAALLVTAAIAIRLGTGGTGTQFVYCACLVISLALLSVALLALLGARRSLARRSSARYSMARRAFPPRRARGVFPGCRQSRRRRGEPVCSRLRPPRTRAAAGAAVLSGLSRRHERRRARRRRLHVSPVLGVHVAVVLGAGHGASSRRRQRPCRIHLSRDGELRDARACCSPSACWRVPMAVMHSPTFVVRHFSAALAAASLSSCSIGAGSKAGLVPLHVWLPLAHPAAPSHVSALMSGVMTKVAVYGFIRIVFDLARPAGLVVGMRRAWARRHNRRHGRALRPDAARSQAAARLPHGREYRDHLIGLGLALAFQCLRHGLRGGARADRRSAHVFNHSVFKSLLFFGAGAVLTATGERDMEHLGGLIHRMPKTAFAFLVGCAAISALPPSNGFVSEWLTFQAILLSPNLPSWDLKIPGAGSGQPARAVGSTRGGLLRQGLRHHLSRPRRGRRRPNVPAKPTGFRWPRCSFWRALPSSPASSRACSSMPGAGGAEPGRRTHAAAERRQLALDRADRRKPKLL